MKKYRILVFGKGGREHSIAWRLLKSPSVEIVFVVPGNPGMIMDGCVAVPVEFSKTHQLVYFAKEVGINLIVIQQDDMLAKGWADIFRSYGFKVFGPSQDAAQIESSKAFAKRLMKEIGIPTAGFEIFTNEQLTLAQAFVQKEDRPYVVKASGLALGKGARVCSNSEEALQAIDDLMIKKVVGDAGDTIVIEEKLEGLELSVHALSDGHDVVLLPPVRDHKHLLDGNKGPMTGGMGVCGPIPVHEEIWENIKHTIVLPCIRELERREKPFVGLLYPGLMLTADGPKVLEFNARFGDPEAQAYMMLLADDVDFAEVLMACVEGRLADVKLEWKPNPVFAITLASKGYPENPEKEKKITVRPELDSKNLITKAFHCGTQWKDGRLITSGGRVATMTSLVIDPGKHPLYTWGRYPAVNGSFTFEGMQSRSDIGLNMVG